LLSRNSLTYMNESGAAVIQIMEQFKIRLLICYHLDDFQLPLGTLRLRVDGSDGGHNGLASIIYQLQRKRFRDCVSESREQHVDPGSKRADVGVRLSPFEKDESSRRRQ